MKRQNKKSKAERMEALKLARLIVELLVSTIALIKLLFE